MTVQTMGLPVQAFQLLDGVDVRADRRVAAEQQER